MCYELLRGMYLWIRIFHLWGDEELWTGFEVT
jgi:hypothetical protein